MNQKKHRLLYIVSHPIQYQAPLLRLISQTSDMEITTVFYWDKKAEARFDEGFNRTVEWDVPLLSGYQYFYLNACAKSEKKIQKLLALWKMIDSKKYDIVWTHGYADFYTIAAIFFAKLKGLKVFVRGESMLFDKTHIAFKKKLLFKILNKFVDRYLSIGTHNRNFYFKNGICEKKVFLCHYAVNNDYFRGKYLQTKDKIGTLKLGLKLDTDRPIILYASKFITRKHPIDLLNAYFLLSTDGSEPKPYLLLIGTGETYGSVLAKAAEKKWDSIRFLGFKNQSELPDYYALADILVLPSERENWGLVVNEAMNADCAIIVSDQVGCAVDLVQEGANGYIYPARDVTILSHYLSQLTSNPERCEKMKIKSSEIISTWGLTESVMGLRMACESLCVE